MISKELSKKLEDIILSHDIMALKNYSERYYTSKVPGDTISDYSMYGNNGPIGYLLTMLTDEEKEEMTNFTIDDLNIILYRDRGISIPFGIQRMVVSNRNSPKKEQGRWGL